MFYIVSTPIGNLEDITLRALRVLKSVDLIYCEDTRTSKALLNHHEISTPLKSLHKFNEKSCVEPILAQLKEGKTLALISDAGTPLISDPGEIVIRELSQHGVPITAIPGPSSVITALSLSGLQTQPFQFLGFLPKKQQEKTASLYQTMTYPGVSVFFESAKRVQKTLQQIQELSPERSLVVAREMTKLYESVYRGSAEKILQELPEPLLGEVVILLGPMEEQAVFDGIEIEKHLSFLQEQLGCSVKEAIKLAASLRSEKKSDLYAQIFIK